MTTGDVHVPTVEDAVAEVSPRLSEHYNANYADAVDILVRARLEADRCKSTSGAKLGAKLVTITVDQLIFRTADTLIKIPFPRHITSLMDLEELMLAAIATARGVLGIKELTSPERQAQQINAVRTYVTKVVRVEQVTPIFRQITFGGGDLECFSPGGLDQFLYVLAPPVGSTELTVDASFSREDFSNFTAEDRPVGAYYTLRRWRPGSAELDMLFVLHGLSEDGDEAPGLAARWALNARPGDPVALWGPRTIYDPPADTDLVLLVGDETGLPAICVILENLPAGTPAYLVIELGEETDRLPLPDKSDIHVTWLLRDGAPPGTTTHLVDAVRDLNLPKGTIYAWGGAEARAMRAISSHLRRDRCIPRERVRMTGYWRHTSTQTDLNTNE